MLPIHVPAQLLPHTEEANLTLGVGGILAREPADIVRRLTFATKEAAAPEHRDLFEAMARVNLAHAVMLHERHLVPPDTGKLLVRFTLEVLKAGLDALPIKAENGDLYPQIEAIAASRIGPDAAGFLQLGRSRGDVIPAAMRIKLRTKVRRLLSSMLPMRARLLSRAREQQFTLMPAYTHWQQSQIMTVGHFLARFGAWFERDHGRLVECLLRHDFSPLGAANGVGTSVNVDRDYTSGLLGHAGPVPLAGDAVYAWDYMIEPVSCCALFTANASRLMGNLILWHTREFGMVRLSDGFATASTYLPQKRNPEPLETVKAFAELVQGDLATVYLMARNEDWPHSLINHGYPAINRALDLSTDSAQLSEAILADVEFVPDAMRRQIEGSFATASEMANTLVAQLGMPFREAHEIVGLAVRAAISRGESALTPDGIRKAASELGHHELRVTDAAMQSSLDPEEFVRRMTSAGGVAPDKLAAVLDSMEKALEADRTALAAVEERLKAADDALLLKAKTIARS